MLINAGINEIIYEEGYPDELTKQFMAEADIIITQYKAGGVQQ